MGTLHKDLLTFMIIPHSILFRMRNISHKRCRENQNTFNLQAPCVLYIGQTFRYSPQNALYIFNQQIYFNI
jgi:hypothetical protein